MDNYKTFKVPKKSGGYREILAPSADLKLKQQEILGKLYNSSLNINPYAYGFIPGKDIYHNALVHAGKKFILNVDIKDFFPSCKKTRKIESKLSKILTKEEIDILFYEGYLPQGAPTSPYISNLYLEDVDEILPTILRTRISDDIRYSRYADDITISSNSKAIFSKACYEIISTILLQYGFQVNRKKTKRVSVSSRQDVTGLVVNSGKPTVSRQIRRNLRAAVYNITTGKVTPTTKELNRIKGHLAFCMQVPEHREWAAEMLRKLGVNVTSTQHSKKQLTITTDSELFSRTLNYCKDYGLKIDVAKVIVRSKNTSPEQKAQQAIFLLKEYKEKYMWLVEKLKYDHKASVEFIQEVFAEKMHTDSNSKAIIKKLLHYLPQSKKTGLLIAYPELKKEYMSYFF